jgi:hypothetical protein
MTCTQCGELGRTICPECMADEYERSYCASCIRAHWETRHSPSAHQKALERFMAWVEKKERHNGHGTS